MHSLCPGYAVSKGNHEARADEFVWVIGNVLAAALGCFSELIPSCCWPPVLSSVTAEHTGSGDVVPRSDCGAVPQFCLTVPPPLPSTPRGAEPQQPLCRREGLK